MIKAEFLSIFFFTNDLSKTFQLIIYLLLYYSTNLLIFVTYVNVNIFFISVSRLNSTMNNSFYVLLGLNLLIGFSESLFHAECSVKWTLAAYCPDVQVWQYGLWSFQTGGTKLERLLPQNQHTQRLLLNFENWVNGEVSKIGHHFSK